MKNSLFDAESWLWKPFGYVADFLILSALWLLCSVPIVTAGAAFAALYDCCARCVLGGEQERLTRCFRTFRRELKLGSGSFLLWAAVLGGGGLCLRLWLPIMVVPGIAGGLAAYILEPVFQKYEAGLAGTDNENQNDM